MGSDDFVDGLDDHIERWLENDQDNIHIVSDLCYTSGTSPASGKEEYQWRVNVYPDDFHEDNHFELIGDVLIERSNGVEDIDKVYDNRDKARQRAVEVHDYLEQEGLQPEVDEQSFSDPEKNYRRNIPESSIEF